MCLWPLDLPNFRLWLLDPVLDPGRGCLYRVYWSDLPLYTVLVILISWHTLPPPPLNQAPKVYSYFAIIIVQEHAIHSCCLYLILFILNTKKIELALFIHFGKGTPRTLAMNFAQSSNYCCPFWLIDSRLKKRWEFTISVLWVAYSLVDFILLVVKLVIARIQATSVNVQYPD